MPHCQPSVVFIFFNLLKLLYMLCVCVLIKIFAGPGGRGVNFKRKLLQSQYYAAVYKTTDGGKSFNPSYVDNSHTVAPYAISCPTDGNHCWFVTYGSGLGSQVQKKKKESKGGWKEGKKERKQAREKTKERECDSSLFGDGNSDVTCFASISLC